MNPYFPPFSLSFPGKDEKIERQFCEKGVRVMHEIRIERELYAVYPEIRLGCLQFYAKPGPSSGELSRFMENDILPRLRRECAGKNWEEIPGIRGSRAAYRAFGRNPGRYRVSSEALLRRVKRGEGIPPVNTVVDVNNMISLQSGLSLGSYDLSRIKGAVRLRRAGAGEGYRGIGKDFLDMENMLVLSDDEGIFGSSMSDSTRAMLREDARNILTVIYCFEKEIPLDELLCQAKAAFEKYAGAKDVEIGSV